MAKLHPALQEFKLEIDERFDWVKAGHLLSRAGFGGKEDEIEKVMELGPGKAVDWLMDFPSAPAEEQSDADVPDLSKIEGTGKNFNDYRKMFAGKTEEEKKQLRQMMQQQNRQAVMATIDWWVNRMQRGAYPLQEKLVLFWHGHFATSAKDERSAWLMWKQNELHREMAAGNFKEYVHRISHDPAMLDYLNNQQNHKNHPNENYARELMELFTLEIGNYTENDIKNSARAFSGWAHNGDEYVFHKGDHDEGVKTFMGRSGNFNGDDIVEIIFQQPACAKYIARKLFTFFAYEEPEEPIVESLAQLFRESKWELRPVIRTILTSKAFYSDKAIGAQIKSPVQLVVGTGRMLDVEIPEGILRPGARGGRRGGGTLDQMGQVPLFPPNVKGWPGGRMWISTSTLFVRYNTCLELAEGPVVASARANNKNKRLKQGNKPVDFEPKGEETPEDTVDTWVAKLIQRPIEEDKRQMLVAALGDDPKSRESLKKMVQLIVSMPEYQLC